MGILNFIKGKIRKGNGAENIVKPNKKDEAAQRQVQFVMDDELSVVWEQLPETYDLEKYDLSEINDGQIIARLNSLVPAITMSSVSVLNIIKNVKNIDGVALNNAIAINGGALVNPQTVKGAKRILAKGTKGGFMENVKALVQDKKVNSIGVVTNAVNATISIASMVVGQYYMDKIDKRMRAISDNVSKLIEYFDSEYYSRVASLTESVYNVSKFKMSSVENEELRNRELDKLQNLRMECQTLLILSENQLAKICSKRYINYSDYWTNIKETDKWRLYEQILLQVLHQINTLDFALHLGVKSHEQCFGSYSLHEEKYKTMREQISNWHKDELETLKIDLAQGRRRRGVLGYVSIPKETVEMIRSQMVEPEAVICREENLFERNVRIFAKNGRYFYLPDGENKGEEVSDSDAENEISESETSESKISEIAVTQTEEGEKQEINSKQ